ncbi:MAG: DUF167 domain-containing protein [Anaerolineaceae bacterium]|nr:DUF167 domain-containing protein [Anaerolineaceae bacterium]
MGVKITVKIIPNSRRDKICGYINSGILKIKIIRKPIGGQANKYLIKLLSEQLGIPKRNVSIIKGERSRIKIIELNGITKDIFNKLIINGNRK